MAHKEQVLKLAIVPNKHISMPLKNMYVQLMTKCEIVNPMGHKTKSLMHTLLHVAIAELTLILVLLQGTKLCFQ